MRIAFLPDYFLPHVGGMEIWTYNIARELGNRGHDATVFAYKVSGGPRDERFPGFSVRRVGVPRVAEPHSYLTQAVSWLTGLPRVLLRESFDAYLPTLSPLLVSSVLGVSPLFPVWHGYHGLSYSVRDKGSLKGRLRFLVESAGLAMDVEGVVVVAEHLGRQLTALSPDLAEDEVHVVRGGVDPSRFAEVGDSERLDRIVFLGRIVPQKAPLDALAAFVSVAEEFPGLEMVFVGSGPLLDGLRTEVESLDGELSSRIRVLGRVDEEAKISYLASSRLLVVPSVWEAFPLVVLESLACGTPFVGYGIPALREIVGLTGGGVLASSMTRSSLGDVLRKVLAEDRDRSLGERGRRSVLSRLTWARSASQLEMVLD